MNMSFDVHVKSKDIIEVKQIHPELDTVYITVEDANEEGDFCLYFPNTAGLRAFLAKVLNELHKVECGDIPFAAHSDHIALAPEYEVVTP